MKQLPPSKNAGTLYTTVAGAHVKIPHVDPAGCDLVFWTADGEVFFVEVLNGQVRLVLDSMLAALMKSLPEELTIGFVLDDGTLAIVGKNRLQ